jgi:RNA polymerase sigma-70 factor, ECF subfamily
MTRAALLVCATRRRPRSLPCHNPRLSAVLYTEMTMTTADTASFETYRPLLFSLAYRLLGSATEAEDIVQEAYLRYQAVAPGAVQSPKAFLSTIVTRLCLNQLQSARVQREAYLGPWLPEPILTETDERADPQRQAELHDSISFAFLALLEALTPLERAVFILREVFDYDYAEIAAVLDKDIAACRQVFSRAKKHVADGRPRFTPAPETHRRLLSQFMQAAGGGDLNELTQLLSAEVIMWADGGGKARGAALYPLRGAAAVAQFVRGSVRLLPPRAQVELAAINGELATIARVAGQAVFVLAITVDQDRVSEVRVVGNPDKLHWVSLPPANSDGREASGVVEP